SAVLSWTSGAVSRTARGIPCRSTTRCRLLPGLPRSVGFGPVAAPPALAGRLAGSGWPRAPSLRPGCPGGAGGGADLRRARPLLPGAQPPPAGHAGAAAHLLRQHLPRDAALEHEEDAGQRGPGVDRGATAPRAWRRGRKQGAEKGPEGVGNEGCCHAPSGGKPIAPLLPNQGSVRRAKDAERDEFDNEVWSIYAVAPSPKRGRDDGGGA